MSCAGAAGIAPSMAKVACASRLTHGANAIGSVMSPSPVTDVILSLPESIPSVVPSAIAI